VQRERRRDWTESEAAAADDKRVVRNGRELLGNCSFRLVHKGRNLCQSEPAPTSVPSTGHPL
jgi:hypothetical protein